VDTDISVSTRGNLAIQGASKQFDEQQTWDMALFREGQRLCAEPV